MKFIYPYFLFAASLIIIPVIVHLFNFRKYKKVYFSNVDFLNEIKSRSQKTSVLKHLLVLISRILAIISIVIAFAQPYIPLEGSKKILHNDNAISVFIDNSFSMEALNANGPLFNQAKQFASDIVSVYKPSDFFQILSNDFEAAQQRFININDFRKSSDQLMISSVSKNLSQIAARQKDLLLSDNYKSKNAFIISDFQKSMSDFNKLKSDSSVNYYLIPLLPHKTKNVFIDSIWFDSPVFISQQSVKLFARIKNISDENFEKIPLKLFINQKQRAIASFDISSRSHADVIISYSITEQGINSCYLELSDFPITFDNKFFFSYNVLSKISIASINNNNNKNIYINNLFSSDSLFSIHNFSQGNIDFSSINNYSLIIFNDLDNISSGLAHEIALFVKNGGSLIVFPGENLNYDDYNRLFALSGGVNYGSFDSIKTNISHINLQNPVFNDVFEKIPENLDLPWVSKYFSINATSRSFSESLLKLQNNKSFLLLQKVNKGKIFFFASPLKDNFTNFHKHSIFVPTIYKIALLSVHIPELFYIIGVNEIINISGFKQTVDNIIKVRKINSDFEFIPQLRNIGFQTDIILHSQIYDAGNYIAFSNGNALQGISFNYNRNESDLDYYSTSDLKNLIDKASLKNFAVFDIKNKSVADTIHELNLGIRLWKLFVFLALFFIAAEIALLRFFK